MPIYAYRCTSCGHSQDVLQKMSDPLLTVCPSCGASTYAKQVTAAGFQLKGSGWYVTDFRGGAGKPGAEGGDGKAGDAKAGDAKTGDAKTGEAAAKPASDAKPAAAAAPAPKPAASPAPAAPAPSAGKGSSSSTSGS